MMRKGSRSWLVVALLALFVLSIGAPCLADNDGAPDDDGDPIEDVPLSRKNTLNPTAGILSDFWMILMAMAFQLAL